MVRLGSLFCLVGILLAAAAPPGARAQGTRADYERASHFLAQLRPADLVSDSSVTVHWIGNTHRLWLLSRAGGKKEFLLVDAEKGSREPAFDHARLAEALSGASGQKYDPAQLPLDRIVPTDDGQAVRFQVGNQGWKFDLKTGAIAKDDAPLPAETTRGGGGRRGGRGGRGGGGRGNFGGRGGQSPDGQWRVNVRENNLYLTSTGDTSGTALTQNGTADDAYRSPSFSPDSRKLMAFRTRPGDHKLIYNVDSHPAGTLRPVLRTMDYDLPGDKVDVSDLYVFDVATRLATKVDIDTITYNYGGPTPAIHWLPGGHAFLFRQMYRGYGRTKIEKVDADTSRAATIIDNKSATFVNPLSERIEYLDDTNEILWTSERDGWNHIYLLDSAKGGIKNQVTQGEWVVKTIENVDREKRQITFSAGGREAGEDPYYVHYYRVNFDGSGLTLLDPGDGTHGAPVYSADRQYLVDTYSRVDLAPVTALYRASDGMQMCELAKADDAKLRATDWRVPERFVAKGRDEKTDIYGVIWRPSNLDPDKKYPVIEDIYGGPQDFFAPKAFVTTTRFQALAELGFIVVKLDGMGTAGRSKAFHDVCWKNLGDSGFPDRIAWIKAAAAKYPYMDTTRVGIYGTSAGGYNAAHALIVHPEFYKVAVANSGNHDHRTDKVWWNELYMSYPIGPWYAEQSNVEQAAKLQGKLMLVIGGMDNNVNPFASTYQFVDALEKANKDYELVVFPEDNHGTAGTATPTTAMNKTSGPYRTRKMWDFFVENLLGVKPPAEFKLDPSGPPGVYRDNTN